MGRYKDLKIFGKNNEAHFTSVKMGTIGNCYYASSLQSAGEYPEIIRKVFQNEKNKAGIYALRMFIRGKPWTVTIDDYLYVN